MVNGFKKNLVDFLFKFHGYVLHYFSILQSLIIPFSLLLGKFLSIPFFPVTTEKIILFWFSIIYVRTNRYICRDIFGKKIKCSLQKNEKGISSFLFFSERISIKLFHNIFTYLYIVCAFLSNFQIQLPFFPSISLMCLFEGKKEEFVWRFTTIRWENAFYYHFSFSLFLFVSTITNNFFITYFKKIL